MLPLSKNLDTSIPGTNEPDWKLFKFSHGSYLLHTPTSRIVRYNGERDLSLNHQELAELAYSFKKPADPVIKVNITSAALNLAQGCNLRCTYCFAGDGDYGNKTMMTFETAKKSLQLLAAGKDRFHIAFFGGEPLLNFKTLKEVVSWTKTEPQHYTYSITTNGTLLSEDKLQFLKEHRFSMNLSYDGKGVGDKQRFLQAKGATNATALIKQKLARFESGLNALADFRLRGTITKANLPLLKEAILDTLTSTNLKFFLSHHGTADTAREFTKEDAGTLVYILREVHDLLIAEKSYSQLLRLERLRDHMRKFKYGVTGGLTCGAGLSYLSVSALGNFYLCHRFTEDESERVGSMETGLDTHRLQQIQEFRQTPSTGCSTCWMRQWCRGGCFHEHKAKTGDALAINPLFCHLQDLELKEAMRVYTYLQRFAPEALEGL